MGSTAAIRAEALGKCYRISGASRGNPASGAGYRTLREDLVDLAQAPLRALRRGWRRSPGGVPGDQGETDYWALRDVQFEIAPGEVLGVIGRNGAGKSTLLKVLSRITPPTTGLVELRGRVGSLLEVGTGFHPELTGRENIFLNGAVLGMRRHEIASRFDRIVEFAEIGPFLDTPVKRYSSGMYVRLAFAVAAHLEPEILIVDEVLAVGDAAFQRKCLGRMREVGRTGCTVLFVSHSMPAIETLCTRALLLDQGRVARDGPVPELVREYHRLVLSSADRGGPASWVSRDLASGRPDRALRSATLLDDQGRPADYVPLGGRFRLRVGLEVADAVPFPTVGVGIDDGGGQRLLTLHTPLGGRGEIDRVTGRCAVECVVDALPLAPGDYWVKVALSAQGQEIDSAERALHFTVTDGEAFGEGRGHTRGVCVAPSRWSLVGAEGQS